MNNISYVILACHPDKGMKSYGSKSLMVFNNKKLLEHQINTIHNFNKKHNYEIVVVSSFETHKLQKIVNDVKILDTEDCNPIIKACKNVKYNNILFIDYGCVINQQTLYEINLDYPFVVCMKNSKNTNLDIGCIIDNNTIANIFFDLPENKFCNMFYITKDYINKLIKNKYYHKKNLLYFEIINMLISSGSIFKPAYIDSNNYIYFNNMRQKNVINKFIQ